MINLTTKYAGMTLRNPLIVSSSGLTDNLDKIKKLEEAGAGAVVLKSLFEEQIQSEATELKQHTDYPQAEDYFNFYVRNNSVDQYLQLIQTQKYLGHISIAVLRVLILYDLVVLVQPYLPVII